jgi:hypothetical protein
VDPDPHGNALIWLSRIRIRIQEKEKIGKFVILRYDKISSQNMQCKRERIRQKFIVKKINLPKLFIQCKKSAKLLMLTQAARGLSAFMFSTSWVKITKFSNKSDSQPFRKASVPT